MSNIIVKLKTAQEILQKADELEAEAKRLRDTVKLMQRSCQHEWDHPEGKYTPEYTEAYTDPGDPPGTMGVDFRGPVYVPAKTTKKWTRVCKKCGFTQTTNTTKLVGHPLQQEVPDFGKQS